MELESINKTLKAKITSARLNTQRRVEQKEDGTYLIFKGLGCSIIMAMHLLPRPCINAWNRV